MMMRKILSLLIGILLIMNVFGVSHAQEELNLVTSFYPIHIFTQNILKNIEGINLTNLTHPSTGCLHDYQLLASDMVTLSRADALLINGGGMESFLPMVEDLYPNLKIVDSSNGIQMLYSEEHQVTHEDEEDGHQHDHGEFNAHIWLDAQNAIIMTRNIAQGLKELLPSQADDIEKNTLAYIDVLNQLDTDLKADLHDLSRRDIVTFHDAFAYFANAYDLNVVAVLVLEPDESLTPQMLKTLIERVWEANLPPLFTEPQYDDRAAKAVAQETGAPVYELDPIVTGDGSIDAYQTVMRKNAKVLIEALGDK